MAEGEGFQLGDYLESITSEFPLQVLEWLNGIPDFRIGYELTPQLIGILREVGIEGDFGNGGHRPEQWPEFGSVQKTLPEFMRAYDTFRADMVRLFKESRPARAARRYARQAKEFGGQQLPKVVMDR